MKGFPKTSCMNLGCWKVSCAKSFFGCFECRFQKPLCFNDSSSKEKCSWQIVGLQVFYMILVLICRWCFADSTIGFITIKAPFGRICVGSFFPFASKSRKSKWYMSGFGFQLLSDSVFRWSSWLPIIGFLKRSQWGGRGRNLELHIFLGNVRES